MSKIDKKGGLGSSLRSKVGGAAKKAASSEKGKTSAQARESTSQDKSVSTAKLRKVGDLDRDSKVTKSDPAASREVSRRQASTAKALTEVGDGKKGSLFDSLSGVSGSSDTTLALAGPAGDTEGATGHLVDDPVQDEQRSNLENPEGFEPGAPLPEPPNLDGHQPKERQELPTGDTLETYEVDGVVYTRTERRDGSTNTSYEVDGVRHSSTLAEDGSRSYLLSTSGDDGTHSRSVETNADGTLRSDSSLSSQGAIDPQTGEYTSQQRQESLNAEGVRTITEEVRRPDGGRSELTRTEHPDQRVSEVYSYEGEQGTVQRTTEQAANGASETRTERTYQSEQSLEELAGEIPAVPNHAEGVVPLPTDRRGPTTVRELEVETTDAQGNRELQYAEESFSQTSGEVELVGSQELGQQTSRDTFPVGIFPRNEDSNITHTVTRVRARDDEGVMQESVGASQTVVLAGERADFDGGGEVRVSRTDTWNSAGESSSSFLQEGFKENELYATSFGRQGSFEQFHARVGQDPYFSAGYPGSGKSPRDHYHMKGGGELDDWFGIGGNERLDVGITVSRDADGRVINEATTFSTLDENGEGKTATRSDSDGAVSWVYTDFENRGNDYRRQTVLEGSELSIYEEQRITGPGEFTRSSETREGDEVIAESSATRQRVDEEELRSYVADGRLTQGQFDRMQSDGPPYFVEEYQESAEPVTKDGDLVRDDDGNPVQLGHQVSSLTIANGSGYSVSEQSQTTLDEQGREDTESRLSTVTDPNATDPITGALEVRERDAGTGSMQMTESASIEIDEQGRVLYDGAEVGSFDLQGSSLRNLLRDNESVTGETLIGLAGSAAALGESSQALSGLAGGRFNLTGEMGNLSRLGKAVDIFGVATGATGLFHGARQGDLRAVAEGFGDIAGGLNSLAAATSALSRGGALGGAASRFSTLTAGATTLGKALGAVGGVVGLGFGLHDLFTAESGHDRAAGGLAAAAGAVAIGSAFFGPPGWVIGGLISGSLGVASILVGGGDDRETAPIDERLH